MNRNLSIICFLLIFTGFYSCDDKNEAETGLIPTMESFNLTFIDYASLPMESQPAKNRYFSTEYPAKNFLPVWLQSKIINVLDGSTATVSYDFKVGDRPELLQKLGQELTHLTTEDYKKVWGLPFVNALTPVKSPSVEIPKLLKEKYPSAAEGEYRVVEYYYSEEEPTTVPNTNIVYLQEGFTYASSLIDNLGWYNISTNSQRKWGLRTYTGVVRAMATANGLAPTSQLDSWLISPEMDFSQAVDPQFTFSLAAGYYTHHCISVMVSTDYIGGNNPLLNNWDDVTDDFQIPREGSEGYGKLESVGTISMVKYAGKTVHVAFRFTGKVNPELNRCTAYELDDVIVSERADLTTVPSKVKTYSVFVYQGGTWVEADTNVIYALQSEDYTEINTQNIDVYKAGQILPPLLRSVFGNTENGKKIVIVYKTSGNNVFADEFTLNERVWQQTSPLPLEIKEDKYVYEGNKWIYENQ